MIIVDDTPSSPSKNPQQLPGSEQISGDGNPPPPAYTSYQQSTPYAQPVPSSSVAGPAPALSSAAINAHPEAHVEPAGKRFLRAFAVALLIYVLVGMFAGSAVNAGRKLHRVGRDRDKPADAPEDFPQLPPQVPPQIVLPDRRDGRVIRCASGAEHWSPSEPFHTVSYELPLDADVLYLFARGSLAKGEVTLMQNEDPAVGSVHVDVSFLRGSREAMDASSVCLLERQENQFGVGILTPSVSIPNEPLQFFVTVRFPHSLSDGPLNVTAFETDVPLFSHHIRNLDGKVSFKSLSLKSTNARVMAQSLFAENAVIKTTNSAIQGNFRTSRHLSLVTTNAPIQAFANLYHDDVRQDSTELVLSTSNGAVTASVQLLSPETKGGSFNVSVKSSNKPVNVEFAESPLETYLDFTAVTTNAAAKAALHPAFEGSFSARTSNKYPVLQVNKHTEDPAGEGRARSVESHQWKRLLEGRVVWGEPPYRQRMSTASIQTTNALVALELL